MGARLRPLNPIHISITAGTMQFRKRKKQKGIALILVLLVLSALLVIVLEFSFSTTVEQRLAANCRDEAQSVCAAGGGVNYAKMVLALDLQDNGFDCFQDKWNGEFVGVPIDDSGDTKVSFTITDESARFNLNRLGAREEEDRERAKEQLERLLDSLEDIEDAGDVAEEIIAYAEERVAALEEAEEEEGGEPASPATDAGEDEEEDDDTEEEAEMRKVFLATEELLSLESVTAELFYGQPAGEGEEDRGKPGLKDYLTVWSSGRVNVNTAPVEVLLCLSSQMDMRASQVVDRQEDQPFESDKDAKAFLSVPIKGDPKLAEEVGTSSRYFSVTVEATRGNITKRVRAVLKRPARAAEEAESEPEDVDAAAAEEEEEEEEEFVRTLFWKDLVSAPRGPAR